jgi:hypothetical protein
MIDLPVVDREQLRTATAEWIADLRPWRTFNTLTFREPRRADVAVSYWRRLVQVLNRDAFGDHYVRKVGHCYFSHVRATEYQQREALHFHFLADRPLNFDLVHSWWGAAAGFAWLEVIHDRAACVGYISKYILKSSDLLALDIFENEKQRTPLITGPEGSFYPYWWKEIS